MPTAMPAITYWWCARTGDLTVWSGSVKESTSTKWLCCSMSTTTEYFGGCETQWIWKSNAICASTFAMLETKGQDVTELDWGYWRGSWIYKTNDDEYQETHMSTALCIGDGNHPAKQSQPTTADCHWSQTEIKSARSAGFVYGAQEHYGWY